MNKQVALFIPSQCIHDARSGSGTSCRAKHVHTRWMQILLGELHVAQPALPGQVLSNRERALVLQQDRKAYFQLRRPFSDCAPLRVHLRVARPPLLRGGGVFAIAAKHLLRGAGGKAKDVTKPRGGALSKGRGAGQATAFISWCQLPKLRIEI